jgi:hypothetical protein
MRPEPYQRDRHYRLIAQWWRARDADPLPAEALPATGSVVLQDEVLIAAAFVYLTNARAGYVAFPVCAPELAPVRAARALAIALRSVVQIARAAGCLFLWSATENRLIDRLLTGQAGFVRSTPHYNYFQLLDPELAPDMLVGAEYFASTGD